MYMYISDMIKEEIEGIQSYTKKIAECKDAKLKEILVKIRNDEKTHVSALIGWLNSYVTAIV